MKYLRHAIIAFILIGIMGLIAFCGKRTSQKENFHYRVKGVYHKNEALFNKFVQKCFDAEEIEEMRFDVNWVNGTCPTDSRIHYCTLGKFKGYIVSDVDVMSEQLREEFTETLDLLYDNGVRDFYFFRDFEIVEHDYVQDCDVQYNYGYAVFLFREGLNAVSLEYYTEPNLQERVITESIYDNNMLRVTDNWAIKWRLNIKSKIQRRKNEPTENYKEHFRQYHTETLDILHKNRMTNIRFKI